MKVALIPLPWLAILNAWLLLGSIQEGTIDDMSWRLGRSVCLEARSGFLSCILANQQKRHGCIRGALWPLHTREELQGRYKSITIIVIRVPGGRGP